MLDPKKPEDIYKSHLEDKRLNANQIDSAKENLSSTYTNAFVNAGYGNDALFCDNDSWIHKNKDSGMAAATASLGMVMLWDIDEGLSKIDKYMEARDDYIVAGSYMAAGLLNTGIRNENDPVKAVLEDKLQEDKTDIRKIGALLGLSFTYAGSAREDLLEIISPIVLDGGNTLEL